MSYYKTSKHKRYSDKCGGEVTVAITPLVPGAGPADECAYGKSPVRIKVGQWSPSAPMCVYGDHDTRQGRQRAADDAVGFYEAKGCGTSLDGWRRRAARSRKGKRRRR